MAEERNKIVWETPENSPKRDDYIFHHGKRMVRPYYFEFIAHVVETRFASNVIVLRRLMQVKEALTNMVTGNNWAIWRQSNTERATNIRKRILDEDWWERVEYLINLTAPIMIMLRYADMDRPCLGEIYDGIDSMLEKIEQIVNEKEQDPQETFFKQLKTIIIERWNKMTTPLHLLAYALTPKYYSTQYTDLPGRLPPYRDIEVSDGYKAAFQRLFPDDEMRDWVTDEFIQFVDAKNLSIDALRHRFRKDAHSWWYLHGQRFQRLQPLAIKVISQVKKRWAGKTVVDLFSHEFRQRPYEYYVEAVKSGRICVDGNIVPDEYIVKASQTLSHFVHRHEPPVMAEPIVILDETSDVITVCKPSSIPVHPCGQYRKNTVIGILEAEHGIAPLFPIHRLDRLVSGLLIFAKNAATANRFREEIEAGKVQKEYVAKVKGVFPAEEVEVDASVIYDSREGKSTTEVVNGSMKQPSKGKTACTKFVRLGTNGIFSIVKCFPVSGRTHQIRVHLQHLGHPISNDALYSVENPPERSIEGTTSDQAARRSQTRVSELGQSDFCSSDLSKQCNSCEQAGTVFDEDLNKGNPSTGSKSVESAAGDLAGTIKIQKVEGKPIRFTNADEKLGLHGTEKLHLSIDSMCTNCPNVAPAGYDDHEDGLLLHCVRYSGPNWAYECPLPQWALI